MLDVTLCLCVSVSLSLCVSVSVRLLAWSGGLAPSDCAGVVASRGALCMVYLDCYDRPIEGDWPFVFLLFFAFSLRWFSARLGGVSFLIVVKVRGKGRRISVFIIFRHRNG